MSKPTPIRAIQISDLHLKTAPGSQVWGVDVDANLRAVLARIQARDFRPDFILATGDLVGDEPDAYERVREFLSPLGVPVYCLPGNHDQPARLAQTLRGGLVRWERHILVEPWQLVLLDSTFPNSSDGHLSYGELALLDTVLVTPPARPTLVCLHHNPVPIHTDWLDDMTVNNGEALFAVLDRYPQIRAVVWGHIHGEFDAWRGAVRLLGTPATCVQFKLGSPKPQADSTPPGYRWFELFPDGSLNTGVERVEPARRPSVSP